MQMTVQRPCGLPREGSVQDTSYTVTARILLAVSNNAWPVMLPLGRGFSVIPGHIG